MPSETSFNEAVLILKGSRKLATEVVLETGLRAYVLSLTLKVNGVCGALIKFKVYPDGT